MLPSAIHDRTTARHDKAPASFRRGGFADRFGCGFKGRLQGRPPFSYMPNHSAATL